MNDFMVLLIIAAVGMLAFVGGIGMVLGNMPGFEQIDLATAVYGLDGGQYVLLHGRTFYNVLDPELESGCYQLTAPEETGGRGTARKVWMFCGW